MGGGLCSLTVLPVLMQSSDAPVAMNLIEQIHHLISFNNIQAYNCFAIMSGQAACNDIKNTPLTIWQFLHVVTYSHNLLL